MRQIKPPCPSPRADLSSDRISHISSDRISRIDFAHDFERRIFVVRGVPDDCVYLFKEDGTLLDEPGSFTPGGVQPLEGENGFLNEWQNEVYCTRSHQANLSSLLPFPFTPPLHSSGARAELHPSGRWASEFTLGSAITNGSSPSLLSHPPHRLSFPSSLSRLEPSSVDLPPPRAAASHATLPRQMPPPSPLPLPLPPKPLPPPPLLLLSDSVRVSSVLLYRPTRT